MNADILPRSAASYPKGIPFDFTCPNMQDKLMQRVCKQCELYHASVKSVKGHEVVCKQGALAQSSTQDKSATPWPRVRPVRVAAKRQRELMCVIQYMDDVELE